MKKLIAVLALVFAIVTGILSVIMFDSSAIGYTAHEVYGGDAYTGIQNAAADTANSVRRLNDDICVGFGSILLVATFAFALVSARYFYLAKEETAVVSAPTPAPAARYQSAPVQDMRPCESCGTMIRADEKYCTNCGHVVDSAEKSDSPTKMHWTCTCGMKNTKFTSICISCGKPRPGDGYQKCPSCGAMVRAGESCPLCEK